MTRSFNQSKVNFGDAGSSDSADCQSNFWQSGNSSTASCKPDKTRLQTSHSNSHCSPSDAGKAFTMEASKAATDLRTKRSNPGDKFHITQFKRCALELRAKTSHQRIRLSDSMFTKSNFNRISNLVDRRWKDDSTLPPMLNTRMRSGEDEPIVIREPLNEISGLSESPSPTTATLCPASK